MPDFKQQWLEKAELDFFAPFLNLWLACNSWYKSHYSDISTGIDRDFINRIKSDFSTRNHLYEKFCRLIDQSDMLGINFRANLEQLHFSLERATLQPEKIRACSFTRSVLEYSNPTSETDLIFSPRIQVSGELFVEDAPKVIKLNTIYVTSNKEYLFPGLFEIIYQVRCILVHGNLSPEKDEHNVVKYCYLILWDLMS